MHLKSKTIIQKSWYLSKILRLTENIKTRMSINSLLWIYVSLLYDVCFIVCCSQMFDYSLFIVHCDNAYYQKNYILD